jgi:arylsulfatase A-like enzyme
VCSRTPVALLVALALAPLAACSRAAAPNVLLIVVDTLRADRLSCQGYPLPTTPHIDSLAARGIRFANVSSTSGWTLPAHASLFTGLFPIEHRATQEHTVLDDGPATLAGLLRARGYVSFAVSANPVVSIQSGLARGFDEFAETWRQPHPAGGAPEGHPNVRAARRFLAAARERPFFLFVNYVEAHAPYDPPKRHRARFLGDTPDSASLVRARALGPVEFYLQRAALTEREHQTLSGLYDGEVAYADELVGALLAELERAGRVHETVVIVTSDHGENLGDHGHLRHVFSLDESVVRVPLVVALPDGSRAGEVREEPASLVDLFATVLARAAAPLPAGRTGRDLLDREALAKPRPVYAEYHYPLQALELFEAAHPTPRERERLAPYLRRLRSVELDGLRYVWGSDGRHALFDRAADPREERDLAGTAALADSERRLRLELDRFVARGGGERPLPAEPQPGFAGVDEESAAQLRALGYVP